MGRFLYIGTMVATASRRALQQLLGVRSLAKDHVLADLILPYIKEHNKKCPRGKQVVFVHDNAPCHGKGSTSSKVSKWLKAKKVKVCPLAPCSPDTTPIELVFGCVKQVCKGKMMRTKEDIVREYEKAWEEFPMENWDKMIARLPGVLKQIKKDKGGNFNTV